MERKSSEILRAAAALVESGKVSAGCIAIAAAVSRSLNTTIFQVENEPPTREPYRKAYRYFRGVGPARITTFWWAVFTTKGRNERVLGLCFAAAIAESEGD